MIHLNVTSDLPLTIVTFHVITYERKEKIGAQAQRCRRLAPSQRSIESSRDEQKPAPKT